MDENKFAFQTKEYKISQRCLNYIRRIENMEKIINDSLYMETMKHMKPVTLELKNVASEIKEIVKQEFNSKVKWYDFLLSKICMGIRSIVEEVNKISLLNMITVAIFCRLLFVLLRK